MAVLGWLKLPYGVSLADEGMYVADAWRLVAGDRLFPDAATGVVRMYALFNAAVFWLHPDVTLLGFRQLQFVLTLAACGLLGVAVWRVFGPCWWLPWVLSLFAFTGLDPVGKVSSLSYYHYPHLFLTGHVALLLLALSRTGAARRGLLLGAGVCLWGIGFALLPLSVVAIAPVLLAVTLWWLGGAWRLSLADLFWLLAPVGLLWGAVLAWYGADFFTAMGDMLRYARQGGKTHARLDMEGLKHAGVMLVWLGAVLLSLRLKGPLLAGALGALGGGLYWIVATGLGGLISPYWRGWFSAPMWLCGLLMAGFGYYLVYLVNGRVGHRVNGHRVDGRQNGGPDADAVAMVLIVPAITLSAVFAYFSEIGFLTVAYGALPALTGLALLLVPRMNMAPPLAALGLVALLGPLYWQVAWADWRFTLFDLSPKYLTKTVADGFLKGIRTNGIFYDMDRWMRDRAERFSTPDDLAIAMNRVPMVHVQIRRRPAMNHSWVGMMRSALLRFEAVNDMVNRGRQPKIAFRFVRPPMFLPVDLNGEKFMPAAPDTFYANNSTSNHITQTMKLVDTFRVRGQVWVEFYVRPPVRDLTTG